MHKFQNKASGIILIKQDYKNLFYDPSLSHETPVKLIQILFYTRSSGNNNVLSITIETKLITIRYEDAQGTIIETQFSVNEKLFPEVKEAPQFLQKKIWIELNRLNRTLKIFSGDVAKYSDQKPLAQINFKAPGQKQGWKNQADFFPLPGQGPRVPVKKIEPFTQIQFFQAIFLDSRLGASKVVEREYINEFLSLQILELGRIFSPIIDKKVSLLRPNIANLAALPTQLQDLYELLEDLSIRQLPDLPGESTLNASQRNAYLNWHELQFALHYSLTNKSSISKKGLPLGIINHLYKLKYNKQYTEYKGGEISEIYKNRDGYIRFELLPHEGLGPGSMAVLEMWPPFHCSPIHNHGEAFGVIKVLSGAIRVENYSDLTFAQVDNEHSYLESNYVEDQYTWLSENSFGIHRLVNVKPQSCFTLQSYYSSQVTEEYFSCIEMYRFQGQTEQQKAYVEYYPQNDWVNFLNTDDEFVKKVIDKYGLKSGNGQIDTSFERMVLTLKREYEEFLQLNL